MRVPSPPRALAISKKVMYVGALSSTDDRPPVKRKNVIRVSGSDGAICSRKRSAGAIVAKMPMKRIATSLIGPHVKALDVKRTSRSERK